MFGRKKVNKLIEDIDRYFDLMDQSVLIFKEGVRNYLYSHTDAFNENLMKMSAIDSEASVLRREIENALYTQTALVRSRGDIMRLFEKTRNITDILNDSLFQFEIGVQSTNPKTIEAINRNVNFEKLSGIVQQIKAGGNIHQHLDLIAGLPHEDYASFARSFNDVYALKPEQLQLGFLKVLKGSMIYNRQHDFSIVYQDTAPYEVLTTHMLPYEDTLKLKAVEEMVETYYNSGKFLNTLEYLVPLYDTPFAFFEQLSQYWIAEKCHYQYQSKIGLCNILWQFAQQNHAVDLTKMQWLIKFDLALHEKPKKLPEWLVVSNEKQYRNQITAFYRDAALVEQYLPHYCGIDSKVTARQTHLEVFGEVQPVAILFDYEHKDLLQNAQYMMIPLEELARAEANLRMEK